jgi:hypothetical protein
MAKDPTIVKDYWDEEDLDFSEENPDEKEFLEEEYDPGRKKKWV